jgi:hypothetical protein
MDEKENDVTVIEDAYGKLRVTRRILKLIRDAILFIYPAMVPGDHYTGEELLGPEIWEPWSAGRARFLGRCLAWMERNGLLPIRRVTPIGEYPVRYSR